ncbi:MAG: beta-lactamase, partial [Verrucomicrobiales bacterium]|nr:beta-lactamase [Verrucomicrobiales bacterium]
PDIYSQEDANKAYSSYTVKKLYAFLSGYTLTRDPGAKWEYSNVGMALLAHVITLKAKADYESLVVERICRPLKMDSTRITLTDELKSRVAKGHDRSGHPLANQDFLAMSGASALRSTANDLLKYVSANAGLTQSSLTPLMEKTQRPRHSAPPKHRTTAMDWYDHGMDDGTKPLGHGGQTVGYNAFVGFDREKHRGVVVLFNQQTAGGLQADSVGWLLLEGTRLTPQTAAVLLAGNQAEIVGIGAELNFDGPTHALKITKVFPNSPAAQAGLSVGLVVQKVNDVPTSGKSMTECLGLIRGKAGTTVRLELVSLERKTTNTVELIRQKYTTLK